MLFSTRYTSSKPPQTQQMSNILEILAFYWNIHAQDGFWKLILLDVNPLRSPKGFFMTF